MTYEDGTACSKISTLKIQVPGKYPEERIKDFMIYFWNILCTLLRNHGLILRRSKKYFSLKAQTSRGTQSAVYPVATIALSSCIKWLAVII
jgi:hypothetical protein